MSAVEALNAARAAGMELALDGDDLALSATSAPPAAMLDALARQKAEIVALLLPGGDGWSAKTGWSSSTAGIAEFDGGLPRGEAEARAFECCVVEWLNRNPVWSRFGRCLGCGGGAEQTGHDLLPALDGTRRILDADAPAIRNGISNRGRPGKPGVEAMSIELKGRGYVSMHEPSWDAVQKIAREFGWMPEYERKAGEETGLGYGVDDVPEHNARALAMALYRAIHDIEADCLSEPLLELVKMAGVGRMREVADLAFAGTFYID
jgi:hypothetical protein